MRQKICTAIKTSIQGLRFTQLGNTLEVSQDLTQVLDLIQGYCKNVYNVLEDLKHRLEKLSAPRSRVIMYNNCLQIANLIRQCQERDYVKDISNILFELMTDKALMYSYRQTFERTANEALLDTQLNSNNRDQTKLESALEALQDPGRLHFTGANLRPVTEQIKNRIALLFQFINKFLFTYHSEMCLPEE